MHDKDKLIATFLFTAVFISLLSGVGLAYGQDEPPSTPHCVWGDVTYEDDSPAANVTINFVNDAGDTVASDVTNDDGYYDTDLPPGLDTNIPEPDDKTLDIYVGDWDSGKTLEWESAGTTEINISGVPKIEPTVTTESTTNVTTTSATLNMSYDFEDYDSGDVRFEWRESGESWNATSWISKSGSGSYSKDIDGLASNTDHEYKAQVRYDTSTKNGSTVTFTTQTSNQPPDASFSYSPSIPNPGDSVSFDASNSLGPDGTVESYEWSFGDGSSGTGETVSNSYLSTGDYDVTLTVTDDDGDTDSATKTVSVVSPSPTNDPPTADTDGPYSVDEGETVELDGTGSSDPDGSIESYSWEVTNGPGSLQNADSSEPTYVAPNDVSSDTDVTVELTVTDDDGATDTATATLTVNDFPTPNDPPTADTDGPYSVDEGETVELDGTGSSDPDGDSLTYSWSITDDPTKEGSLKNANTAEPTLQAPSVDSDTEITVELTVDDGHGHSDTATATVTVNNVPEEGFPWRTTAVIVVIIVFVIAGVWYWYAQKGSGKDSGI